MTTYDYGGGWDRPPAPAPEYRAPPTPPRPPIINVEYERPKFGQNFTQGQWLRYYRDQYRAGRNSYGRLRFAKNRAWRTGTVVHIVEIDASDRQAQRRQRLTMAPPQALRQSARAGSFRQLSYR